MSQKDKKKAEGESWANWLGYTSYPKLHLAKPVGHAFGFIIMVTAILFCAIALWMIVNFGKAVFRVPPFDTDADGAAVRNIGLVLAALFGAPFLVWRTAVAAKQVQLAEEAHFNEKMNAAATDLAARRTITSRIEDGESEKVLSEEEDDLVTRVAAIDRLEGLAAERPEEAPRIARMLSTYVREISGRPENAPITGSSLRSVETPDALPRPRSDIEAAVYALGRIRMIEGIDRSRLQIDLRNANLQRIDFKEFNFSGAIFLGAFLDHASFSAVHMFRTNFSESSLVGARFSHCVLQVCDFDHAKLRHTTFADVQFLGSSFNLAGFFECRFDRCEFDGGAYDLATFDRCSFRGAKFNESDLDTTSFLGCFFDRPQFLGRFASLSVDSLSASSFRFLKADQVWRLHGWWPEIFADGTVEHPPEVGRPTHWLVRRTSVHEFHRQWRDWQATLSNDKND